jgi:hypothetical protein
MDQEQDWFAANAPTKAEADWFDANSPKQADAASVDDTGIIGRMLGLGQMRRIDSAIKDRQQNPRPLPDDLKFSKAQEMATVGGAIGGAPGAGVGAFAGSLLEGKNVKDSAVSGAMNAVIPKAVEKGIGLVGRGIQSQALPLVLRATKPAVSLLRKRAQIEGTTSPAVAKRIGRTILDGGFKNADDAIAAADVAERGVDDVLAAAERENPNLALDTAERIPRYLNTLLRKVEGQMTPGRDRTAIQNFGRELVKDSPLSARTGSTDITNPNIETALERIAREAMNQGKSAGQAAGTTGPSASYASSRPRALRTDVKPSEGMAVVRNKSFYNKDASDSSLAAGKTTERAVRDAVKQTVPAAAPFLKRQGNAIDASKVLEAMGVRDGARDSVSLTGAAGFASKTPMLGVLMQVLRNSQLPLGHLANKTGGAMQRNADSPGIAALVRMLQSHED